MEDGATRETTYFCTSQSRNVSSRLPLAKRVPSREKATALTIPVCPSNTRLTRPACTSHKHTVLLTPPPAINRPSGEKASELLPLYPSNLPFISPVATFHSTAEVSALPPTNILPSGEKARVRTHVLSPVSRLPSTPVTASQNMTSPALSPLAI